MKPCILCGLHPAIENSHVVSKFVVKRLKEGTPHGILRHSTDPGRVMQDGWKGEYLCLECENKFSKWEGWFASKIYNPYLKGTRTRFPMSKELALFAASVHFRHIHYVLDVKGAVAPQPLADLRDLLRRVCLDGVVPATGLQLYLEFESLTDDPRLGFPAGLNAYLSDSIDGRLFEWNPPGGRVEWISFVKLPSMLLFCSLVPILGDATGAPIPTEIKTTGTLNSETQGRFLLHLMREEIIERIQGIQDSYQLFPAEQHARNVAKIQAAPNIEEYRAHQAYLADQRLQANWVALQAAASGSRPPCPAPAHPAPIPP